MGTSTNGQICYGIAFEEEFEFPWGEREIDEWWIFDVQGFKHSFEIFDASGNYLDGREPSKDEVSRYFAERRKFAEEHPLPVMLETHCSGEYPMYILAVKGSCLENRRGYPAEFDPAALVVTDAEHDALLKFCADHGIAHAAEPKWLLTSYWG